MIFDSIEWDENNLDHACRRVTAVEIEEVIASATSYRQHGRHLVRPITAWEES